MPSSVAPLTLIPSVGSRKEVSSRIPGAAPLLFKAYRLDVVGSGGCELLPVEGQLDRVLNTLQDNMGPVEFQEYLAAFLQVERPHQDLRDVYGVLLSDSSFNCQTKGQSPGKNIMARQLRVT